MHITDDRKESAASAEQQPPERLVVSSNPASPAGARAVVWFAGLFALAALLAALGKLVGNEALQLVGGYGVVFVGVGGAPFQLRIDLDLYARLTGSILVGFSVVLGVGALMADISGAWYPVPAAIAVGAIAVTLHLLGLLRARAVLMGIRSRRAHAPVPATVTRRPRSQVVSLGLTAAGTALWLVAASATHDPLPGFGGFLATITPIWYVGLVLLMVGFAVGRGTELCAGLATLSFGMASTLTPALVYAAPSDTTALKQMTLTQYVLSHHHIAVTSGIYQAYSAMFSGMAWLFSIVGVHGILGRSSLIGVATYWPFLLVFMRIAELRLLSGGLLTTTPRRWAMVMLALLVDTSGTDYYSPQSIGYVLAIGVIAIAIKGVTERPLGRRGTVGLLALVGLALAPTHELSPYLAGGALLVLALFGQAPLWACLLIILPAVAWAGVVHNAVEHFLSFGQLFEISNLRPPVTYATPGLQRMAIVGYQSHTMLAALLILIGLGAIGFFSTIKSRATWAYALCPIVGIALILVNPYGNEGIFRATVFAIPWMATLAVRMPRPGKRLKALARPALLTTGVAGCCTVLTATFVVAAYGMDATSVISRGDVQAGDYLERNVSGGAVVMVMGFGSGSAGSSPTGDAYSTVYWPQLLTQKVFATPHPTAATLTALTDMLGVVTAPGRGSHPVPLYVVWSRSDKLYDQAYGLQSAAQADAWLSLLHASADWKLVMARRGTYVFSLR